MTLSRSNATSDTVMLSTATTSRLPWPAICRKGTRISAPMDAGVPTTNPAM